MARKSRRWFKCLAASAIAAFATSVAIAAPSTTIVISQVYGGGGNSGATFKNDFIELHNISGGPVDVTGWSVQYKSATSTTTYAVTPLTGIIASGAYFLVQEDAGSGGTIDLPTPDVIGTINLGATSGKIALVSNTTALEGTGAADDAGIVDFVGFGSSAITYEGSAPAPAPSNTNSLSRQDFGSQDTDQNSADFVTGTASPRNSASGPYLPAADSNPPVIVLRTPDTAATGVSIDTEISVTFDEPIISGAGTIHLFKEAGSVDEEVPIGTVDITDNTASFTPTSILEGGTLYYVLIDATAFTDLASPPNAFPGISSEAEWTFTTVSALPPVVGSLSPADDSLNQIPTTDLSITYDKSILVGSGTVLIKKFSDGSIVDTVIVPSSQVTVSGTTATINPAVVLEDATAYYVEVTAGAFQDAATNPAPAITGNSTWSFTTRAAPSVVISQYYEGASNNKYIELRNLTGSPIDLTGYRLTAWSSPANEAWKTGSGTTPNVSVLDGETIPANGYFLIGDSSATGPGYAFNNTDLWQSFPSGASFSGTGSVVLYSSATNDLASVVDAVSIIASEGTDTSFYRLNNGTGFDFSAGSSILDYSTVWGTKTVAQVDAALVTDDWYLQASQPPVALTLSIVPTTISEGAGDAAATATVTRDGTAGDLDVFIAVSDLTEAYAQFSVTIPDGESFATFPIDAVNDLYLDGDQPVTVTVSSTGFTPASEVITVTDELTDAVFPVVINEVDSSQDGTDVGEFIELYNNSSTEVSLDGVVLVFYNGGDDESDFTIDLTGQVIAPNGFFVIGNSAVANVDIIFPNGDLQDGPEALALYLGSASDYSPGTPVATTAGTLMDAMVYGTNDSDNTVLLAALTPGKPQVNEGSASAAENVSMSRLPDGGAAFDTTLYVTQTPTPGATNILPSNTLAAWISGYDVGAETGINGDFDNDGLDNAIENILGSNPSLSNTGMTNVSSTANSITFQHTLSATPASDLTAGYEWSTDMATWYPDGASDGGTTVSFSAPSVITAGPPDLIEVTATADGPVGKLFARLKVTNP